MQPSTVITTKDEVAEKNKFESFKLGKGLPSGMAQRHAHTRSHSRNTSITSSISPLPFTSSKSTNSLDTSSAINTQPPSKRNSHHRRRSSVSTRVESAEMMGVSIPDLPSSISDDNINLGEKDSIRRRALWALEGKPDVSFSKVEIPELSTPVMEKMMFDLASKPSLTQNAVPSYGSNINTLLANKRDSFKLLPSSSSSKDQLHTLVEEEEEEDDDADKAREMEVHTASITPDPAVTKPTFSRPRPANLNLRPLSLTPDNIENTVSGLPTPSPTPSPRMGLKSLALAPSSTVDDSPELMSLRNPPFRRLSLNLNTAAHDSPSPMPAATSEDSNAKRRSSISYKSSSTSSSNGVTTGLAGLPTPEMTPTSFDRRYSLSNPPRQTSSSSNDEVFTNHPAQTRPLSASEQHFLFKSHNALLARITDLERALSMRRMSSGGYSNSGSSRPVSLASECSSSSEYPCGEPSDEMLRLIADLKAERDELKRDVDGWRNRVGDMEKQLGVVAGRVESERRDAWVARSMAGLLEVEKKALERKLEEADMVTLALQNDKKALTEENDKVKEHSTFLQEELEKVKCELHEIKEQAFALATPVPKFSESRPKVVDYVAKKGLGFTSVDSESSSTDVEDSFEDSISKSAFPLISVLEDDEDACELSDEDNGLVGYEDENDSDVSFRSSSSMDLDEPRPVFHLQADVSTSVTPIPQSIAPAQVRPTHVSRTSLSTWTFPTGAHSVTEKVFLDDEEDRFFGCLQDNDDEGGNSSPIDYSYERSKGLFASGFKYGSDDDAVPFFSFGAAESSPTLDVVPEEDEDDVQEDDEDENMFGEVGGIRITFTPPQDEDEQSFDLQRSPPPSPVKTSVPAISFFGEEPEEGESISFNFGRPLVTQSAEKVDVVFPVIVTPPSSLPRSSSPRTSPPSSLSSIPRPTFVKPTSSFINVATSTPPREGSSASPNAFVTPPNRRGGAMPSFIPQPVASPSPIRNVPGSGKSRAPGPTFIRQPQRKPLVSTTNNKGQNISSGAAHGSTFATQIPTMHPQTYMARSQFVERLRK